MWPALLLLALVWARRRGPRAVRRALWTVVAGALVYRDDNHFTGTFAATLSPWLDRELPAVG